MSFKKGFMRSYVTEQHLWEMHAGNKHGCTGRLEAPLKEFDFCRMASI